MVIIMLTRWGNNSKKLNIDNCLSISFKGFEGTGVFSGAVRNEKLAEIPLLQKLTENMIIGDYKVTLKADKEKYLKNGDKIKLHLDYNEELYKRNFGVKLTLKNPIVEVSELKKVISKESDLTNIEWENLNKEVDKKVDELAEHKGYKNKKYLNRIIFKKNEISYNGITYWYKFNTMNGEKVYVSVGIIHSKESEECTVKVRTSEHWHKINVNKPFDEILEEYYLECEYKVLK